ncbi:MAG: hypothetical protein JWQ21_2155 [Herminiimonas sp.]|nr:hypothetical protein [Herminiimonas sp.]
MQATARGQQKADFRQSAFSLACVNFWWEVLASNQRPIACEAIALPLS